MLQRSIAAADTGVGNAMRAATLGHSRAILDRSSGGGAAVVERPWLRVFGRGRFGFELLQHRPVRGAQGCRPLPLAASRWTPAPRLEAGPGGFAGWSATARAGAAACLAGGWFRRFVCHGPRLARPLRRTPAGRTGLWRTILPDGIAGTTAPRGGADLWKQRHQVKCWARCLFISNMVTLSWPNTFRSFSSARISRRFSGFCRLCDRM